jgi:diketogulonate reductase-like aldo/keto reductase
LAEAATTFMLTKELGKTGVSLTEIGQGTWHYHAGPEPLRRGLEAGARFIDTAESYGTESVVGDALSGRRGQAFLATKVSSDHFRRPDVFAAADRSLRALRTDHIDLYQLHEPNPRIPVQETLDAMEALVDAGKVRFIGVSNFSVPQLRDAQRAMRKYPIVANQVRYNLADRTIEPELLPYCEANHITVIAYSPLGRELRRILDCDPTGALGAVAQAVGRTVPQVALNWCLCRPAVVAIPKGNSVEHILENCGASDWRLSPEHCRMLDMKIEFRCRGRAELLLRRIVPGSVGPLIKRCLSVLPRGLRRRLN